MTAKSTMLTLNNGVEMPALGLGVFQSAPEETAASVTTALQDGYRLIDTAAAYGNEKEVGEGIRRSGVDRGEVFVTTKLWLSDYGYDATLRAFDTSLDNLGLDYLDLYLLHFAFPSAFDSTVAAYKAMEKLLADGRVRAIGVSNFSAGQLRDLIDRTDVVPAVNQVELHPYFIQRELRNVHANLGVVTQDWSPLGGVNLYWSAAPQAGQSPLEDPTVVKIAARYGKTPAQVVLRWHIEQGLSAIPKSVKAHRIAENSNIFDFALTADEVAAVDALDTGLRGGPDPDSIKADSFG
ncbi:aldo/keto reductase [Streptomyces sp. NPDC060209]|uniref:aldo/keto reductase n=1 Tax=Streptomyces sp. NPDC060209 TaxID=3347073 RepID=UPI00365E7360